jgi:hypothetical protein
MTPGSAFSQIPCVMPPAPAPAADVLFNNVGINIRKPTLELSHADFSTMMTVNIESGYNLSQLAFPLLKASGAGLIIMNSSVAGGPTAMKSGTLYAMTKVGRQQQGPCAWLAARSGGRIAARVCRSGGAPCSDYCPSWHGGPLQLEGLVVQSGKCARLPPCAMLVLCCRRP